MSLLDTLLGDLPPLDARLRRPEVEAIAARIREDGRRVSEALAWLGEGDAEIARWEEDLALAQAGVARGEGRAAVLAWLDRRADPARHAGDRRAATRRLGIEVIRERTGRAVEAVGVREEILLKLLVGRLPVASPAPAVIVEKLASGRRWTTRLAAGRALGAHRAAGGSLGDHLLVVRSRADAAGEHPWVRDACDAVLVHDDPDHLAARLTPADEPRHFLIRRLRVERLLRDRGAAALPALEGIVADPSEHVRIGLAGGLARLGTPGALGLLGELAAAAEPRVRLAAAEHLRRTAATVAHLPAVDLVTRRLAVEEDDATLQALSRAAQALGVAAPAAVEPLRDALGTVLRSDRHGAASHAAALARGALAPDAPASLTEAVAAALATHPRGERRYYRWTNLGLDGAPPADVLGRALVPLTTEDVGLWVEADGQGLSVQRGDRFVPRLWRLLHELRHPAPNKRAGANHLLGRRIRGSIRVPPGRLAEVTATAVPGERTVVEREGGWVPGLPTVDDLLDLDRHAAIYSPFGVTELHAPGSWGARIVRALRLTWHYPTLARLRQRSLAASDPGERREFVTTLERDYGVEVRFRLDAPAPTRIESLHTVSPWLAWLGPAGDALLAPGRTSQPSLAVFAAGLLGLLLVDAARRRETLRRARRAIPLVIGGWGTRGKSGTERIKAGMFAGLGHPVLVKTTGCEAMMIPAFPGQTAREVFLFRPHDKSSIWEQAVVTEQAWAMGARVLLWECMALRPSYVRILERDWMRDDLVTLTNAFPDHEDVQGPAGHDVATVLANFVPDASVAVTSEVEFLPTFREAARARGTTLDVVPPEDADLYGADLLGLFPYQEHPRNIALVARVAERLGVDPMLAVVTMAENVVPDLGVLRVYPPVRVAGRDLRFINGMSANERTGCVTNWRRTGCDRIDLEGEPDHAIVVVVNNRADRVARSEVFARILVQDLSADAFLLIGTNLTGLRGYVEAALEAYVGAFTLPTDPDAAAARVAAWMGRLRVALPDPERVVAEGAVAARGVGGRFEAVPALAASLAACSGRGGPPDLAVIEAELAADAPLCAALVASIQRGGAPATLPEVVGQPEVDEAVGFLLRGLARRLVHARLRAAARAGTLDLPTLRAAYRALFLAALRPVPDPGTSGDAIVLACARQVLPGARVTVMGIQNIKGTGLDFAYRWVALGTVASLLDRARAGDRAVRMAALRSLEAFDDPGLVDTGTAAGRLQEPTPGEDTEEEALRLRVLTRQRALHHARLAALGTVVVVTWRRAVLRALEALLEPLDAMRRWWVAQRVLRELRNHHVSLSDAAATMQDIQTRQKGGWLSGSRR